MTTGIAATASPPKEFRDLYTSDQVQANAIRRRRAGEILTAVACPCPLRW
jgi:hypothetical protein